jgi:large exoprotein involved in heme utilization and adhesion
MLAGSFVASTANSVVFDNGFEFSATNPQAPPLLSVNVPLGLQFGANPGSIVNQSVVGLQVRSGRTLALVGGEVALEGGILLAPDGRIELGSVAGNSRVSLRATDTGYALGYESVEDFQDVRLLQNALVNAGGEKSGGIQVQGTNVTLTDGSALFLEGAGVGEGLSVNASESVQVIGRSADGLLGTALFANSASDSTGDVGNLTITTKRLVIRDGAFVSAITFGSGKEGNLTVNASESVQVIGRSADGRFGSDLTVRTGGTSNVGNLTITTPVLLVRDGARVGAETLGSGKGGNLTVNASESVQVMGTSADGRFPSNLSADTFGTGEGGNLTITTPRLLISDGAQVTADTFSSGKGGNLRVDASGGVVQVMGTSADGELGSYLSAETFGTGKAGDLTIITGRLLIADGAQVSTSTLGSGKGGNLMVNASESVQVTGIPANRQGFSSLSVQARGTGNAGNMTITTPALLIRDGAQVSAGTLGAGRGGDLTVNASDSVQVIGTSANSQRASGLFTQANPGSTGEAGNLKITTGELLIRDGAQVSAGTLGAGKGGNLVINASGSVQVMGISADGQVTSILSAQAEGTGDAGNMTITTPALIVRDGAQVTAGTLGAGKGGNLTVKASDSVQLIGVSANDQSPSGLFASGISGGTAGNLTVETGQMSVRDGARVTVSSPQGQAGNLTIAADSLLLNRGQIFAETAKSGAEGGANITLKGLDFLRMDNESIISANALEAANGGNVTIDSTFIVATLPKGAEGSDITANAIRGNGGRVNITTQGLFGIEFREKRTPQNDITVSSDFGLAGVFEQNTPGVDPSRGLGDLPTDVVDGTRLIDNRCTPAGATQRSSFVITGRGGLPPSPTDPLQGESVITNWVTLDSQEENTNTVPIANPTRTTPKQLVEAQSWVFGADGQVILTAQSPTVTPEKSWQTLPSCHDLKPSSN